MVSVWVRYAPMKALVGATTRLVTILVPISTTLVRIKFGLNNVRRRVLFGSGTMPSRMGTMMLVIKSELVTGGLPWVDVTQTLVLQPQSTPSLALPPREGAPPNPHPLFT